VNTAPERLFLRRAEAGAYLKARYGFCSAKSLAKLATEGGGPEFFKAGNIALYSYAALDVWAVEKIGKSRRSTAEAMSRIEALAAEIEAERTKVGAP
jgi:hypothetical protein